jgi:hypothetical protein
LIKIVASFQYFGGKYNYERNTFFVLPHIRNIFQLSMLKINQEKNDHLENCAYKILSDHCRVSHKSLNPEAEESHAAPV